MRFNPIWSSVLSDLFVNLSAAWFGAAFVVPNLANQPGWFLVLTGNLLNGIVFLAIAVKLKELLEQ